MKRTWYHRQTDGTWRPMLDPKPGSILGSMDLPPGDVYDDGFGNQYKVVESDNAS